VPHRRSPASGDNTSRAPRFRSATRKIDRDRPAPAPPSDPYPVALALLAARELSAAQLGDRLRRRHFDEPSIDATLARLRGDGALDDGRAAVARARYAALIKHRGRIRTLREVEALGIDREQARAAVNEVFEGLDEAALAERALSRRLKGAVVSDTEMRRLYQYLVRQGFSAHLAAATVKARRRRRSGSDDEDNLE
jgi:regulatory protein